MLSFKLHLINHKFLTNAFIHPHKKTHELENIELLYEAAES